MIDVAEENTQMPNAKKVDTLQDLIENFKTLINQSRLQEREFLIYNGKLQVDDHHVKSIEIKISFMQQYAQDFIILIIRDTTHRDLLVTLEETNKYKDQLLASVSHELRAPLNGNINLLESALQERSVPAKIKEGLLTPAVRSSKFLLHLINDILDMSQIKAQKLRLIFKSEKLQETLKDTLQLVELHAKKKGLQLYLNVHPEIIRSNIYTDHVRLSQIVLNLLNNAIKFTQKGSIVLSAMPTDDPMLVKISVQDSGMGMTQENIKKLFLDYTHIEFAERKEINPTGVGLGLSIAYNLAKLLGPSPQRGITVESVLSVGSTFSFLLENKIERLETQDVLTNKSGSDKSSRFIADELETFEPKNIPRLSQTFSINALSQHILSNINNEKPTQCTCAKILIVDDNPFNTMAFDAVLGALNFKCDSVFNGQSAIEKVLERQTTVCGSNCNPYHIIFMDQEMPGMNGSETVEEIRKLQVQGLVSPMKIVGCTAHGSTEEVERFMEAGLDMCIHKPITAIEIQKILKDEDLSSPSP